MFFNVSTIPDRKLLSSTWKKKKKKFAWQHFISGFQCFTDGGKIICLWKLQNHTIKFYAGLITMLRTKTFYENYKSAW